MSHSPIFPSHFVFDEYPLFRKDDVLAIQLEHQLNSSICQCENHVEFPCTNTKDKTNSEKCKDCRNKGSDCNRFYQRKRKKKQKSDQQNSHPNQEIDQQNSHLNQEIDQQNSHPYQETDQQNSHLNEETDQQNSHRNQETDQQNSHRNQETDQRNIHLNEETDQQNSHNQEIDQQNSHPNQETDQQKIINRLSLLQNVDCFEICVLSSSILSNKYSPLYPEFVAADSNCFWHAVLLQLRYNKIIWNKNETFVGLRFRGPVNSKSLHERFDLYLKSNENTIINRIQESIDMQLDPKFYRTLCSTWGKFQDNAQLVLLIICIALNCEGMIVQVIQKTNGVIDFIPNIPYILNEGSGRSGRINLMLENSNSVMSSRAHYWSLSVFT